MSIFLHFYKQMLAILKFPYPGIEKNNLFGKLTPRKQTLLEIFLTVQRKTTFVRSTQATLYFPRCEQLRIT